MAAGYVVFDLSAGYGTATLALKTFPPPLPRSDKAQLEVYLATLLLQRLAAHEDLSVHQIRPNPHDPPDVLFDVDGQTKGLEITELLPENRLERDAILRKLKQAILTRLHLSERSQDWVITIMLVGDYAHKIRLPRVDTNLAWALNQFFAGVNHNNRISANLPVPEELRAYVRVIRAEPWDLREDLRIRRRDEPLIVFTAQHTHVVPDQEFPTLIHKLVGRKTAQDLAMPTWLLLWSNHYAFDPLQDQLVGHIDRYILAHPTRYERVFYLHYHASGRITEFFPETNT